MVAMTSFSTDGIHTRTDFDFTPYKNHADVLLVLEYLHTTMTDPKEKSYWAGRIEALNYYQGDKNLDHADQWWALVFTKAKSRQADYRLPDVKTGFFAMVDELKAQKSTARANTRRS